LGKTSAIRSAKANKLAEPIAVLKSWDYESRIDSVPTTLFMLYFEQLQRVNREREDAAIGRSPVCPTTLGEQLNKIDAAQRKSRLLSAF
jgi:hypothetical protein